MEENTAIVTQDLRTEITQTLVNTGNMVVDTAETAQTASNMLNAIASVEKKIKAVFKQPKEEAYAAHKAISTQEKQTLAPLEAAEKDLRNKLGAYNLRIEQERRQREAEERRKAAEEAERKMQEAMWLEEKRKAAEAEGKAEEAAMFAAKAELAVDEADAIDMVKDNITVLAPEKPTGITFVKDYVIDTENIDWEQLPTTINGVPIVSLNTSAVMKLIKASEGRIKIPGLKYQEISKAVRRG